jgi:hypothetical protein
MMMGVWWWFFRGEKGLTTWYYCLVFFWGYLVLFKGLLKGSAMSAGADGPAASRVEASGAFGMPSKEHFIDP